MKSNNYFLKMLKTALITVQDLCNYIKDVTVIIYECIGMRTLNFGSNFNCKYRRGTILYTLHQFWKCEKIGSKIDNSASAK